jgi:hypothetical protein
MKSSLVGLTLAAMLAAPAAQAADTPAPAKVAVMREDLLLPETAEEALPRVTAGQILPALRVTDDGYEVLCLDAGGHPLPALLPFRDAWGHLTAAAWTYDLTLSNRTVRVQTPVALRPLRFRLHAGERFPLQATDVGNLTVRYDVDGQAVPLVVPAESAVLEDVPAPSPLEAGKADLEGRVTQRLAEQAQWQERERHTGEEVARLLALHRQLSEADTALARLKAQVAKEESLREQWLKYRPETAKVQEQRGQDLTKLAQQEATATGKVATAEIEKAALDNLRTALLQSDADVERLKGKAARARAELDGLAAAFSDTAATAEKEKLRAALQAEARKETEAAVAAAKAERERDTPKTFLAQMDAIRQETTRLQTAVETLTRELEQLRKAVAGEADETPAPGVTPTPAAAPIPAAAWAPAPAAVVPPAAAPAKAPPAAKPPPAAAL